MTADPPAAPPATPSPRPGPGPPSVPDWVWTVGPTLVVGLLQLGLTTLAGHNQDDRRSLDVLGYLLLAAGPLALVWRRRWPEAVLAVTLASTLAYVLFDYPLGPIFLGLIVAFVNVVLRGRRALAWASLAVGLPAFLFLPPIVSDERWPPAWKIAALSAWLLVLGTVSEVARVRQERAREAARWRAEESRRRASEERLRMAQELHDVLAHHISLINVQAGVALHLLDDRPEQARPALAAIKEASSDALGGLRSVLRLLRQDEEAPRSPTAGMADLEGLVARTRAAGLDVDLQVEGDPGPLSGGVDLAAFRIVQEALTNVVRHAGATRATVRVVRAGGDLIVQVDDDGQGPSGPSERGTQGMSTNGGTGGNGLAGMRERVSALGGRLETGPRPGRGFRVRAHLPLDESS